MLPVRNTNDVPHVAHLLASVFLCDLWLPIWLLHTIINYFSDDEPWLCQHCGAAHTGDSMRRGQSEAAAWRELGGFCCIPGCRSATITRPRTLSLPVVLPMISPNSFWLRLHELVDDIHCEGASDKERLANIMECYAQMPVTAKQQVRAELVELLSFLPAINLAIRAAERPNDRSKSAAG